MATIGESDEEYARRLQEAELGVQRRPIIMNPHLPDAQTPLMADFQANNIVNHNPTVINTRLSELYAARATVLAVIFTNMPQVIATAIILALHWNDPDVCSPLYTRKWIAWSLTSSIRMFAYTLAVIYLHIYKNWLEERPEALANTLSLRNFLDAIGLVWFVVGNLWLFGDDTESCVDPQRSPIYILCYAILAISYLQICLPCILIILFLPVLCFCMPCLIRILARIQDLNAVKGANEAAIESLSSITITQENLSNIVDSNTCPICISDMCVGDEARLLPCRHLFHQQCVDEWLRVNATCPTCRSSIFQNGGADVLAAARGSSSVETTRQELTHTANNPRPLGELDNAEGARLPRTWF